MNNLNPDLLVSGYFTSLESLLIHKIYGTKVVTTTTYLLHPSEDPAMRAIQNLMAFSPTEYFKLVNLSNYTVQGKNFAKAIDLLQDPEIEIEDFVKPLESFEELIPCPKEYEYNHYNPGEKVHYVEPCILKKDLIHDGDDEVSDLIQDPFKKLIFVTAGSQVLDYEGKAKHLFHCLCKAMQSAELDGYHLILGVGSKLINAPEWDEFKKATNITFASWVPQRRILRAKNLEFAIIHGGLATIKECVYNNKKFLILPMGKDQIDNALRLRKFGIDNTIPLESISSKVLIERPWKTLPT